MTEASLGIDVAIACICATEKKVAVTVVGIARAFEAVAFLLIFLSLLVLAP